jgi:thioredoxin reductase (NADPH)
MTTFDFKKEVPQAFPVLDEKQIASVAEFARRKTYQDGDVLFRAGETDFMFQVIKSGAIEIVDRSSGEPRTLLIHETGEFTGDLANLTGRSSHVDGVARAD